MIMQSKFNLGDKIYRLGGLYIDYPNKFHKECNICSSTGQVTINGETFCCPKCDGKVETDFSVRHYHRGEPSPIAYTIGQVEVKVKKDKAEIRYMCEETGVGSGTVYCEDECFATYEEAVLATDMENYQYQQEEIAKYGHTL